MVGIIENLWSVRFNRNIIIIAGISHTNQYFSMKFILSIKSDSKLFSEEYIASGSELNIKNIRSIIGMITPYRRKLPLIMTEIGVINT